MLKTTAKQRAAVRKSKQKKPPNYRTEEQRKYFREYARKHKHKRNEQRTARRHRHGEKEKLTKREQVERFAGMSFVTKTWLLQDQTRWSGPNQTRSQRLEIEATRYLLHADQIERMRKSGAHHAETPLCPLMPCWCGLCHCTRCQDKRAQNTAPAAAENRDLGRTRPTAPPETP